MDSFVDMASLEILDVGSNQLQMLPNISNFYYRTGLNTGHNIIYSLPSNSLDNNRQLGLLYLQHNNLVDIPHLSHNTLLTVIELSHNCISFRAGSRIFSQGGL